VADGIELLISDHREVEALLERATAGAPSGDVIASVIKLLSIHDGIERVHLYPHVRDRLDDGHALSQEAIHEHGEVSRVLLELDRRKIDDTQVPELLVRLRHLVTAHVAEEEERIFPGLRKVMAAEEIEDLGAALEAAKPSAPTRPHPHVPMDGTSAKLVGALSAPVDRLRDKLRRRP
jgi:hemerythrin superfamily protein